MPNGLTGYWAVSGDREKSVMVWIDTSWRCELSVVRERTRREKTMDGWDEPQLMDERESALPYR